MAANNSRHDLLDEFFALGGNHNIKELKEMKNKILGFQKAHESDVQINDVLTLIKIQMEDYEKGNYEMSQKTAKPVLERLAIAKNLDFYDIQILSTLIVYAETYIKALDFVKKFSMSEGKYRDDSNFHHVKMVLHGNMAFRTLRALYFDADGLERPAELGAIFDEHIGKFMNICTRDELKEQLWEQAAIAQIRTGLFKKDYALVDKNMKTLKKRASKSIVKMVQNEISEYNAHTGGDISKSQCDVLVGRNIKRMRIARNLTQENLAQMLKVSASYMRLVESGGRCLVGHKLYKLSCILNVSMDSFFQGEITGKTSYETIMAREVLANMTSKMTKADLDVFIHMGERLLHRQTIKSDSV